MPLICSADHFFLTPDGKYNFDATKLSEAHAACLREFIRLVHFHAREKTVRKVTILRGCSGAGKSFFIKTHPELELVVDNTNTTATEIAPYAQIAPAYGLDVEIVTLKIDPTIAAARNQHEVSLTSVQRMVRRLDAETQHFPQWWKHTIYTWDAIANQYGLTTRNWVPPFVEDKATR